MGIDKVYCIIAYLRDALDWYVFDSFQAIVTHPQRELFREKFLLLCRTFMRPSLLILFVAGSIRNAGGYVWAYNTQPYFNKYYPNTNVGEYMSWIPLVGGSFGVVLGGFISDRVIKNRGFYARVWVLLFSQVSGKDTDYEGTRQGRQSLI